ncbi:MAG: hypothetical protein QF615_11750 [Planctomycetota bacterium]|jgi:hypothetical protein|nr:hypothetical protein [Planctomycetota bacterium]
MGDFSVHSPAKGIEETPPAGISEQATDGGAKEMASGQLSSVEAGERDGIRYQRPKGFHEIEGKRGPPRS